MKIDLFYEIISQCMINGVRLTAAFFLYRLLSSFVNKKREFASAVLYLAVLTVIYYIPQIMPNLTAYVIAMAAVYIVLIAGDFKKIRMKAFLCITFFALRWLAVGRVSQLMMLINQLTTTLMNNIEIFMTNIPAIIAMFVATEILEAQIDNLKNHIDTAMKSYAEIRAMRHDMANHLMVLNELIESGRNEAAEEYS